MTSRRIPAVVVDTNVLGASLTDPPSPLDALYRPVISRHTMAACFMSEAELRFGAFKAGWGRARHERLEQLLRTTDVVWPTSALARRYVELRLHCHRKGHALAGRSHEADRWIAATALTMGIPLVTHDKAFLGIDGLQVLTRLA